MQNTQKITSAMQMVAASMRQIATRCVKGNLQFMIREVISHLASSNPEYTHEYMKERLERILVISLLLRTEASVEA